MTSFGTASRVLAIGFFLAIMSGCDLEFWFNADGSGRYRAILNEEDIKIVDVNGEGFDKKSKEFEQEYAKTKLRAKMTRDVVFGKTRWIYDLEYDSDDQLSWIDDEKGKQDVHWWKSTTEPNGNVKYEYKMTLENDPVLRTPRQVTVHLPGRIITSNADTLDETQNIATWDVTTHKSITPTVTVRRPRPAK
ncbi:MAG: hypothetical protein ACLQIB_27750 [Isosphaeraceae bacterium]